MKSLIMQKTILFCRKDGTFFSQFLKVSRLIKEPQAFYATKPLQSARLEDCAKNARPLKFSEMPTFGKSIFEKWKFFAMHTGRADVLGLYKELADKLGPVFKLDFGNKAMPRMVVASSAEAIKDVFQNLGSMPMRPLDGDAWLLQRKSRNEALGLLQMNGQDWKTFRNMLNIKLQAMSEQPLWHDTVQRVIQELVTSIRDNRDANTMQVEDLHILFKKMALEVVCRIVMNSSLNSLDKEMADPEAQRFISAVADNLKLLVKMSFLHSLHAKYNTRSWKLFSDSNDVLFATARRFLKEHEERSSGNTGDSMLDWILQRPEVKEGRPGQAEGLFVDLLLAGTDTTSNTLSFLVWHLAKEPRVQDRLRQEVEQVLGTRTPTHQELTRMPYTRQCMKEIMRLESVVPLSSRIVPEECVIGGYEVPPMTTVVMQLSYPMSSQEYFEEPNRFLPERWSRDQETRPHPYASVPFLQGVRMCAGRRIAEIEIMAALVAVVQNFKLEPVQNSTLQPTYIGVRSIQNGIPIKIYDL